MHGVDTRVEVPSHPALGVRERGQSVKIRRIFTNPLLGAPTRYVVHNNTVRNLRRGIFERVLFVMRGGVPTALGEPPKELFKARLSEFKSRLLSHVPPTTPVSREEFAAMYEGRKRTIYEEAVRSLATEGIRPKDANLKTFVKAEKVRITPDKPDPAPRVIQPRDPRYNVEVGRYLKPIEKRLYRAVNTVYGETTVAKGLNSDQRGRVLAQKWEKYRNPVGVGLDATRFDQHVSSTALEWEHSIYLKCFLSDCRGELKTLLGWQGTKRLNQGYGSASDGSVKYQVSGKRMSGDMNTALGNVILMCAMVYAYLKEIGVDASLLNDGDDCVLIFEREHLGRLDGLRGWFAAMGFDMKVEAPVYDLEKLEFCQCQPIWVNGQYRMVRCLRGLSKDNYSIVPWDSERDMRGWLMAVGECGLSLSSGIPIYQEFYGLYVREGVKTGVHKHPVMTSGMTMMAQGMVHQYAAPSARTRFSFWLAFDVTPDEQIAREKLYQELTLPWKEASAEPWVGALSHYHYG